MSILVNITDQVIDQVNKRPVLWDKKHELYGNIQAMDYEWNKVAAMLKRDKEFLKKRWRRVRDVFRLELKKLKAPDNATQSLMNYYTGVWPHFENMLFLKDSLTKRTPRLFFPDEIDESIEALLNKTNPRPDDSIQEQPTEEIIYEESMEDVEDPIEIKPLYAVEWSESESEKITEIIPNPEVQSHVILKGAEPVRQNETVLNEQKESKGVKRKAEEEWNLNFDEDVNFAKSIVGYLKRLSPIKKLMVRNEIQNILLRELLCDKCQCGGQQKACCD